jgi:nitrite reductase/ring-hydroxylating ferredoxin subunit
MSFVLSEDFVKVADTKDIQPSHMKEVEVDGENICVVNIEGKYFAINNICTHEGGVLWLMARLMAIRLNVPGMVPNLT